MHSAGLQQDFRDGDGRARAQRLAPRLVGLLSAELAAAGIAIDPQTEARVMADMALHGTREYERIRRELGDEVDRFRPALVRCLGLGAALAEFATAGVPAPARYAEAVASLGGLALFIVSVFDEVLDEGGRVPELALGGAVRDSSTVDIGAFVALYYARLDALGPGRPGVRRMLDRAIARMYRAELASGAGAGWRVWWRKNVLPFVVMALPMWLAGGSEDAALFRRLAWLARMGQAFGCLDDCVDLERDAAAASLNLVAARLASASEQEIASRVAGQIASVLRTWDTWTERSELRNVYAVVVTSWLRTPNNIAE